MLLNRVTLFSKTADISSCGDKPDRMASASLGPTLLIVISFSKSICSSSVRNPKSRSASSRRCVWMCKATGAPDSGSL